MKLINILAVFLAITVPLSAQMMRMEPDMEELLYAHRYLGFSIAATDAGKLLPYEMSFHFKQSKSQIKKLHETLMDISDPRSKNYGNHLNDEEIGEIVGASDKDVGIVKTWLVKTGVNYANIEINKHNDILRVKSNVGQTEKVLNTDLMTFIHRESGVSLIRAATSYYLPADIAKVISMVSDITRLPDIKIDLPGTKTNKNDKPSTRPWYMNILSSSPAWDNDCASPVCGGKVTPGVIRDRYNIGTDEASDENSMAVAEFQSQYFSNNTLNNFNTKCGVDSTPAQVIGGNNPRRVGVEAVLDIEYIKATAPEVPLTVWYSSRYSLLKWATNITETSNSPLVWSVSYGNDEAQQTGTAYMLQCSVAFQKAGLKGISILFASGDQGACGREGCGMFIKKYHPDFPAANPYITAVGGTDFLQKGVVGEETAWKGSGGGFSNTFEIPEWQADVVKGYKSSTKMPRQRVYNDTGRGYPDISALGGVKNTYCVSVTDTRFTGVAGTSASCPVVAGIFAKLNGIRLASGKSPLGWLNPLIYQNGGAFNDVTTGYNGFQAATGWDPVTGFGTPDYEKLVEIVKKLP